MIKIDNEMMQLTRDEKHLLKRATIKSLRPLKYIHEAKTPENEQLYDAYKFTLKKHGFENDFESDFMNPFYKLAKYDKIYPHDKDNFYLVKLDHMLMLLRNHINIINSLKELPKDSSPHTSYSNHQKFIQKEINNLKTSLNEFEQRHKDKNLLYDEPYNKDYKYYHITISVLELYVEQPFVYSIVFRNLKNPDFKTIFQGFDEFIKDYSKKIFSYKLKLDSIHLTKSFNLHAINIYKNHSLHNQFMNFNKHIDDSELTKLLGDITDKFLNKKAKPNVKNINARYEFIDMIDDILIMQPTNQEPLPTFQINSYENFISLLKQTEIKIDFEK